MEVWKSLSNSDWKKFTCSKVLTHFPGNSGNVSHVIESSGKSTRQKRCRSWAMCPVCSGNHLSRFGTSSLQSLSVCTTLTHGKVGMNPVSTLPTPNRWHWPWTPARRGGGGHHGVWTDCYTGMKLASSGKLGPTKNLSPRKGLILNTVKALLPTLAW